MLDDTKRALDELSAALEAASDSVVNLGPVAPLTDQMPLAEKFLSPIAKYALSQKCQHQVLQTGEDTYLCSYIAKMGKVEDIPFNVKEVALLINKLAGDNLIFRTLSPIQSLQLANMPKHHQPAAVICFVLTPVSKQDQVKAICGDLWMSESGMMQGYENSKLYKELPPGQFYAANIQQSLSSTLFRDYVEHGMSFIDDLVAKYLSVLPKGTTVVSIRECDIVSIAKPYEVIFHHPDLLSIKEVELNFIRHCELIGGPVDGHLKQMDLLTGVTYTTRDGKKL